jgi:serine/threonine-protein kinase PpkA
MFLLFVLAALLVCLSGCMSSSPVAEPPAQEVAPPVEQVVEPPTEPVAEPIAKPVEEPAPVKVAPEPIFAELYVDPVPTDARVRIMNIVPKFVQGMRLPAGRYHVEVTAPGYQSSLQWVELQAGKLLRLKVELIKE